MDAGEPRPLERPRSVAQIIAEALDLYQGNAVLFLSLALGVIVPYALIEVAVTGAGPLDAGTHGSFGQELILGLVDYLVVAQLISALFIRAVVSIGEGRRPRLLEVVASGLQVLPVVVAAVIVSSIGIGLGLLAFVVPGVVLLLRWAVVAQVAAVEDEGWLPSLTRSRALTAGNYLRILGLLLLTGFVNIGVVELASALSLGARDGVAAISVGILVRTISASFSALTLGLLYFDLRARARGAVLTR